MIKNILETIIAKLVSIEEKVDSLAAKNDLIETENEILWEMDELARPEKTVDQEGRNRIKD